MAENQPRQFRTNPDGTGFVEDARWVCPACHTVNVGEKCVACAAEEDDEAKEPTDLFVPDITQGEEQ